MLSPFWRGVHHWVLHKLTPSSPGPNPVTLRSLPSRGVDQTQPQRSLSDLGPDEGEGRWEARVRYGVRCTNRECYLREPVFYRDLHPAEFLAWAHENRWADAPDFHKVVLQDLDAEKVSKNAPTSATGDKGGMLA